jgi:hypothetical protein
VRGYARRKEKGKASQLVVALWPNGHRSGSGDQSLRRSTAAIFEITPQTPKWCNQVLRRCVCSPWWQWCARCSEYWLEVTESAWIPVNFCMTASSGQVTRSSQRRLFDAIKGCRDSYAHPEADGRLN